MLVTWECIAVPMQSLVPQPSAFYLSGEPDAKASCKSRLEAELTSQTNICFYMKTMGL